MAGGEGTRLRPLTCTLPKPLVPVDNLPAMSHILKLLNRHGFKEAAVTTMYLADKIRDYYGEHSEGINLCYFHESKPLGTAGSVKNAESFLDGDFIVISGDGVCDIDLTAAINYHYAKNADVTIVMSRVEDPLEYGVVLCDTDGRIKRFIEKPSWSQAFSDTVNTGIYIIKHNVLDEIPTGKQYDFSRDLFSRMLSDGKALYGYKADGYWCDIGDLGAFYRCNFERSDSENIIAHTGIIGDNTVITDSIIFGNVKIGGGCVIDGAIICENCVLGENVIVRRGCVIGADSVIENNVSILNDVRVCNNKKVGEGITVMKNLVFGEITRERDLFDETGIAGDSCTLSAEYCVRVGEAIATVIHKSETNKVGVICGAVDSCRMVKQALLCGLYAGGAHSVDFGEGFESMAAYAASHFRLDLLLFVRHNEDDTLRVTMYDANGLYPERSFERSLMSALARPDSKNEEITLISTEKFSSLKFMYYSSLVHSIDTRLDGLKVSLNDSEPSKMLSKALVELGAEITAENANLYISINDTGNDIKIREHGNSYNYDADMWHIAAIIEQAECKNGLKTLVLPHTAPRSLEKIAFDEGVVVAKYANYPSDKSDSDVRSLVSTQIWLKDACFAALKICSIVHSRKATIKELAEMIPEFYNTVTEYDADIKYKTLILREVGTPSDEGVCIDYGKSGYVRVIPKRNRGFTMIADAVSMEAAEEILSLSREKIDKIINSTE
jgi:Nucleoside-diphosphate-sugar pyrophosphorylase involved in lipopolysaccharide biosynthesis/translation initiation factor 2B, gamma/epsilon subunits (eIF-2Bgamma/eIF-2Bepsilon)